MSSPNRDNFISFSVWMPLIYFYCLIALARTFSTMFNRSGNSGPPCLVPDLRGNAFSFSPLRMMFPVGLSYVAFLCWDRFFYTHFLESFLSKMVLNFVKSFFCIWFLFFNLLMWCITWLICIYWRILASLGYIPLDHGVWSF